MKINISQILEYQRCPVSWYNKYQLKRGPAPGVALSDGLYFHALCEAYYKELELLPPSEGTQQDAMRAFVEEGNLPKFNIIDVERVIEMPLGAHVLVGTLDGIIYDGSGYQSLQWKTCSGGFDLERQCDAVQYSYHECAYEAMMNYIGYPCKGTYLGVWKKLTKEDRKQGVYPLTFHELTRPPGYVQKIMAEIETWADTMAQGLEITQGKNPRQQSLLPNRRSCIQANIRCAFWDICYNGVPLDDNRYVTLEDRYPSAE